MLEQREKEKMSSPIRRTAALTNRKITPTSSPDRSSSASALRSPPTSPMRIRRRQTKSTCSCSCWRSNYNKSVFIAAVVVFFFWCSFVAFNLLVLEEQTSNNAPQTSRRSMLTTAPRLHAWLRQRPLERESKSENGVSEVDRVHS